MTRHPQEKHQAALAEQEEQRCLDSEMEVERLRALEAYQVSVVFGPPGLTLLPVAGFRLSHSRLLAQHRQTDHIVKTSLNTHQRIATIQQPNMLSVQNRDKQRLAEQQRGAAILREQLAERGCQRMAAEELRDQVGSLG